MSLQEIQAAADALPMDEQKLLYAHLAERANRSAGIGRRAGPAVDVARPVEQALQSGPTLKLACASLAIIR